MEIMRHLVEDIGPRWAGQPAMERAANDIAEAVRALGLDVERHIFPFPGWQADEPPSLEVLTPAVRAAAVALMEYAGSTPDGGITGELRLAGTASIVPGFLEWPRYAIVDNNGREAAYLIAHIGLGGWVGPAIPMVNPDPMYPFPMVVLAEEDHRDFASWLAAGETIRVRLTARSRSAPPLTGHNVVATLPGETDDTIVFVAHLDTARGSPGANNNASGVQALCDIAREMVVEGPRRLTYQFLFADACEWHFLGSRFFVQQARAAGRLDRIKAAINVDTIASGTQFFFLSWPASMRHRAGRVVERLRLRDSFASIIYLDGVAGSDHHSFIQAGIPAAEILFWPCEVYKLPDDDMRQVDPALIRRGADIARALADTFEEDPR